MQENKRSTLSVPLPSTLSSPIKANDIRLAHDPLDMDTLLVWLRMDTTLPGFVRPAYGDLFPGGGWIDPATKATLYTSYQCCNVHEVDKQYMEFYYRLLPSSDSFYYRWQSYMNLSFPDQLISVTASYNYQSGNGSSSHPVGQQGATSTGSHGNVTANPRASSEGSVGIIPEITPVITSIDGRNLEMTNLSFEISSGATLNSILQEDNRQSRSALSRAARRRAERLAESDDPAQAGDLLQVVKSVAMIHNWDSTKGHSTTVNALVLVNHESQ